MNKKEAFVYGLVNGEAAIKYNYDSEKDDDTLESEAFEAEQNARQFTPFEFFAKEVNDCGDRAEGIWESYDEGVAKGIRNFIKSKRKEE